MVDLQWFTVPPLRRPFLLMSFEGLFDAGGAASGALAQIRERSDTTKIAEIDSENFFDFTQQRPLVRVDEGVRSIEWPSTTVWACRTDGPRDLVVMSGIEPHLRWRSFADHIVDVVRRSGAELSITVGAMVSMVPHSRTFGVTGSSADPELADRLGLDRPSYQGPTGVVGVINERLDAVGLAVMSLRVDVPHYVPAAPNPKAVQALLRRIEQATAVSTGFETLDLEAQEWVRRVDAAVASDDESRSYVERLEQQVDSNPELLPTGDDLAAELEAFLRERSTGGDADDDPQDRDEDSA
jgi:hypothetical protein